MDQLLAQLAFHWHDAPRAVERNVEQALNDSVERLPDFALLDVSLGRQTSFMMAERLQELAIRFAFATGYGDDLACPPPRASTPKLRKPYNSQ